MRFVAFGCSHTWGDGIMPGDAWDAPPSKYTWVQHLSNTFNIPILNLSCSGSSNAHILYKIRNHDWQLDDIALILWTFPERGLIVDDDQHIHIYPNFGTNKYLEYYAEKYYTLFPKYHNEYMSMMHIEHAYFYLKYQKIKMVSRFVENMYWTDKHIITDIISDLQKPTLSTVYESLYCMLNAPPVGADGIHYNSLVHSTFADSIKPELAKIIDNQL